MLVDDVLPVIVDLISGELASERHVSALHPAFQELRFETTIGDGAAGTDSRDLLMLADVVSEMFHLEEAGVERDLLRFRRLADWCQIVSAALQKGGARITFRTSGSTGESKRCVHSLDLLLEEVREHARELENCRRVLSMIPAHHIYGLIWTALLPAHLEVEVLQARRWMPAQIVRELRAGDMVVAVPAGWKLLSPHLERIPSGVLGVASGAASSPELFSRIQDSGIDLLEVYGSSETGGVGWRRSATDPFTLLTYWTREERSNQLRRAGLQSASEIVEAPDRLEWVSARSFHLRQRIDGAVQVAGNNVFPQRIAGIIGSHPAVKECAVRLMRPEEGDRLKAFVVWRGEGLPSEDSENLLGEWLKSRLQPFERPGAFAFGTALPTTELGKAADWSIDR